jgi:hypothetical protein
MFKLEDLRSDVMWSCLEKDRVYFFMINNEGVYKHINEDHYVPFEWILSEDFKEIKCQLNEVEDVDFTIRYLSSEGINFLCELIDKSGVEKVIMIKDILNDEEYSKDTVDLNKLDFIDKILASLTIVSSFIIFFLLFNFAPFVDEIGVMYSMIFSFLMTAVLFKKIITLSLLVSNKHKETLKSWFTD